MVQHQPKVRRVLQFSLRSLLLGALICGAGAGLFQRERDFCRRNERSALRLAERGFQVEASPGRFAWASKALGVKNVLVVTGIEAHGYNQLIQGIADEDFAYVSGLSRLTKIDVSDTIVSDEGLKHLRGVPNIVELDLSGTQVTDEGLVHLADFDKLRELNLGHTQVSNKGILHLAKLSELESLNLSYAKVAHDGVDRLRTDLPNCEIKWETAKHTQE